MVPEYDSMRLAELASICEFLETLADEQWDAPSLCEGWRVRDVVGHLCAGYTTPGGSMLATMAKYRFNVPRASRDASIAFGSDHTPDQLRETLDRIHTQNIRKGISRIIKAREGLVDHLIHHQDMRRPLGMPRAMPADRVLAALDVVPTLSGFVGAKKRATGLRLVATDVDWHHGDGPAVHGSGEAILLVLSGRPIALGELQGDGVATLRERLGLT